MSLPDLYMFTSAPARISHAVMGWPFELPTPWRRAWLMLSPITVPVWLAGCCMVSLPLIIYMMFREIIDDIWNGTL
jgi:hypothetical protein